MLHLLLLLRISPGINGEISKEKMASMRKPYMWHCNKIIKIWNNFYKYLNFHSPFSFIYKTKALSLVFNCHIAFINNETTCHVPNACHGVYVFLAYFYIYYIHQSRHFYSHFIDEKMRLRCKLITLHCTELLICERRKQMENSFWTISLCMGGLSWDILQA